MTQPDRSRRRIPLGVNGATVGDRTIAAIRSVEDWMSQPEWSGVLRAFAATDHFGGAGVSLIDDLRTTRVGWTGGETVDTRALVEHGAAAPIDRVLDPLLALEEFGDFCWNVRSGTPRALLHLVRDALARCPVTQLSGLDGPSSVGLPRLARPEAWSGASSSPLMTRLVGPVGGAIADAPGLEELLSSLARLGAPPGLTTRQAAQHADSLLVDSLLYPVTRQRGYRERWEAVQLAMDGELVATVWDAATALGVVEPTTPTADGHDHLVVLGGGGLSPLVRAEYAAEVVRSAGIQPGATWFLGSPRPIDEEGERAAVEAYAPGAVDEFDLVCAAAEHALHAGDAATSLVCGCSDATVICPAWLQERLAEGVAADVAQATPPALTHARIRVYRSSDIGEVRALSASTGRPPDRPNTADTYRLLAELSGMAAGSTALIVTTQVFVPFQSFDAYRMLGVPLGVDAEVIGFGADRGDRPATPEFFLQELLSGIRSARRLLVDLRAGIVHAGR